MRCVFVVVVCACVSLWYAVVCGLRHLALTHIYTRTPTPPRDSNIVEVKDYADERRHDLFEKGQSRRIWGELYKVLDSSDVVIQVEIGGRDGFGNAPPPPRNKGG